MTSKKFVQQIFNGNSINRVGLYEHFWIETPQKWITEGYPYTTVEQKESVDEKKHISHVAPSYKKSNELPKNPYHHFSFDMHPCGGSFDTDPLIGFEEIIEETDEWVVKKNGAGAVLKYWKYKSGTPEHIDFNMTSREIWEKKYRNLLLEPDEKRLESGSWRNGPLSEDIKEKEWGEKHSKWTCFGHVFIWEVLRQSLGDLCMYESLLLDPEWIKDFNRVYTDFYKTHFNMLFNKLGLPDGIWLYDDLAYKNGLFASPDILKSLVVPFYSEITDFFHKLGLNVILHSCGNISEGLPLIIDSGFDAIQPMEIKAGCDPVQIAEQYGSELVLIGGFDIRLLETNDRVLIIKEVERLVNEMKKREVKYILHSDHSIPPTVSFESYKYFLEAFEKNKYY